MSESGWRTRKPLSTSLTFPHQSGYGTRLIPPGSIKGAHFVQTPDYVQITGIGDLTSMNIPAGDAGGELDPHGATGNGTFRPFHIITHHSAQRSFQVTPSVDWSSPVHSTMANCNNCTSGRLALGIHLALRLLTCHARTSCPRLNSASELAKKVLRLLGCASMFTTSWVVAGTCQETMPPARSKTARVTLGRYVYTCDHPDRGLLTCVRGIAYGCLWGFYLVPRATWNPSPPSGSPDIPVYTG